MVNGWCRGPGAERVISMHRVGRDHALIVSGVLVETSAQLTGRFYEDTPKFAPQVASISTPAIGVADVASSDQQAATYASTRPTLDYARRARPTPAQSRPSRQEANPWLCRRCLRSPRGWPRCSPGSGPVESGEQFFVDTPALSRQLGAVVAYSQRRRPNHCDPLGLVRGKPRSVRALDLMNADPLASYLDDSWCIVSACLSRL